jgi:hypothetical protein
MDREIVAESGGPLLRVRRTNQAQAFGPVLKETFAQWPVSKTLESGQ